MGVAQAQMPFADHGRGVAGGLEKRGQSGAARLDNEGGISGDPLARQPEGRSADTLESDTC